MVGSHGDTAMESPGPCTIRIMNMEHKLLEVSVGPYLLGPSNVAHF